jgi:hypothetical protein
VFENGLNKATSRCHPGECCAYRGGARILSLSNISDLSFFPGLYFRCPSESIHCDLSIAHSFLTDCRFLFVAAVIPHPHATMGLSIREEPPSSGDEFLDLIADPFSTSVRQPHLHRCVVCMLTTGFTDPTKLYLRRHRILLRHYWSPLPRLLLPTPSKQPRLRTTSEIRR